MSKQKTYSVPPSVVRRSFLSLGQFDRSQAIRISGLPVVDNLVDLSEVANDAITGLDVAVVHPPRRKTVWSGYCFESVECRTYYGALREGRAESIIASMVMDSVSPVGFVTGTSTGHEEKFTVGT